MTCPRGQSIELVENWHALCFDLGCFDLGCFDLEASDATVVQYDSSLGKGDPNEFAFGRI